MPNTYVDFVSDEHFEKCVKEVCDAYPKNTKDIDMDWLQRNGLDTFKLVFDMMNSKTPLDKWLTGETIRQIDKTNGNWIGKFHQRLLGGVKGWSNLDEPKFKKIKKQTGVDLMRDDKMVFLEIKNKWNTKTGTDVKTQYKKLEDITKKFKQSTAYFAFVTKDAKGKSSDDVVWKKPQTTTHNPKIRKIWGSAFYTLVTKKEDSLEQTWNALPIAINNVLASKHVFSNKDQKQIEQLFKNALYR
jgi:hypothetical protein